MSRRVDAGTSHLGAVSGAAMVLPSSAVEDLGRACRDGGVLSVRSFWELVLQTLNLHEACSCQVLGEHVDRPAVGADDLVIKFGHVVVAVEEADDKHAGRVEEFV